MGSYDNDKQQANVQTTNSYTPRHRPDLFAGYNNIYVTKVENGVAEGELIVTPHSLNVHGIVHGGCLATLADTVAGTAVASQIGRCVTLNYAFQFLHPARGSKITCVAHPQKIGRKICLYRCVLTDEEGNQVAAGDFTFYGVGDRKLSE